MTETLTTDTTDIPVKKVASVEADRGPGLFQRSRGGGEFAAGSRKGGKYLVPMMLGGGFLAFAALAANGVGVEVSAEQQAKADEALVRDTAGLSSSVPQRPYTYTPNAMPAQVAGTGQPIPVQQLGGGQPQGYDYGPEAQPGRGQVVPAIGAEPSYSSAPNVVYATPSAPAGQGGSAESPADRARRSPVMALLGAGQSDRGGRVSDDRGGGEAPRGRAPNEFEQRLESSQITTVRGGLMPNRNFLIVAGSQIPCVLQTALDSSQPGLTSCIIPRSVFSDNGRVVLLEKGTKVLGEYRGGIQQGQNRLFVLWNRAITPRGVSISLGSPAADSLGRAGMPGRTETFFWKRFGGALLLSIVGDASNVASNRLSGVDETSQAPSGAAAVALENDIRIQPVLRAPQGTEMTIFAARDFDFSNVYSLRLRR